MREKPTTLKVETLLSDLDRITFLECKSHLYHLSEKGERYLCFATDVEKITVFLSNSLEIEERMCNFLFLGLKTSKIDKNIG